VCLGTLCYFKYCNFFIESFEALFATFGIEWNVGVLNVLLPVGISFFTFQALSYTIDIMLGKLKPTRDWVEFFVFISFFPQLVAGPIERATNLLPQFQKERRFDFDAATHGICLVAYGLFKKMVVADTLALYVDKVFSLPELYSSITCAIGAFFFSVQIYCDFSGYSDCARGIARLFGFRLMQNFDRPYLATNFIDFWRRWHISLSTWFKDYVYIPLGGSRNGTAKTVRNIWIVFLLSGLWHGAAWTFVAWGALHALFQTVNVLARKFLGGTERIGLLRRIVSIVGVNIAVAFAWIFFRASSFSDLSKYMKVLFSGRFSTSIMGLCAGMGPMVFAVCILAVLLLASSYCCPRDCSFKTIKARFLFAVACASAIVFIGMPSGGEFIYFQF
jgi:D-alanyl-lipoteichoic acid acyltransferase DltB (MBOAT superfamily)